MTKKRILYLDLLKILAALLVIFNHYSFVIVPNSYFSKILFTIMFSVCKIAVPIFIMVSGALLLNKKTTYKEIFTKRIIRIFVPLVVVSTIYVFTYYDGLNFNNIFSFFLSIFIEYDINYIPYWVWYLYLIMALYIMTPFLQKTLKNFNLKDYKTFFILFLIVLGVINFFSSFTTVFCGKTLQINSHFTSNLFSIATGLYVWGYFISEHKITKKNIKWAWLVFFISLFLEILFVNYGVYHKGLTYDEVIKWSDIFVVLASAGLFVIAKYYICFDVGPKMEKFINILSDSSFGVYLTHVFLFDYLKTISFINCVINFNCFVGCILMILMAFIILTILFYVLRKISLFKKFL